MSCALPLRGHPQVTTGVGVRDGGDSTACVTLRIHPKTRAGHKRSSGCHRAPVCGVLCPSCPASLYLAGLWAMVAFSFISFPTWESLSACGSWKNCPSGASRPGMEELVLRDGFWGLGGVFKAQTPRLPQQNNGGLAPGTYQRTPLSWRLSG